MVLNKAGTGMKGRTCMALQAEKCIRNQQACTPGSPVLPGDSGQGVDRRPTLLRVTIRGRGARTHPGPLPHGGRGGGNGRTGTRGAAGL